MVRIALIASEFNAPIPEKMLEAAQARAQKLGVVVAEVARVPGTWEIPLAAKRLLARRDVDAAVAIGAVVTGETKHDEMIANAVGEALMRLQLETGKPIGLGITGPGMTWEQGEARTESAARAVEAAVRMVRTSTTPRGRR